MSSKQNEERDSGKRFRCLDRKIVSVVGEDDGGSPSEKAPDAAPKTDYLRVQEEHRQFLRRMRIQSIHRRIVEGLIVGVLLILSAGITFFLVPNIL